MSFSRLRSEPRAGRSRIGPLSFAMLFVTTCARRSGVNGKSAIKPATRSVRKGRARLARGRRRHGGRRNSERRYPALPICGSRQAETGSGSDARHRDCLFERRHGRTDHVDDPRSTFRGFAGTRGRDEKCMRRQLTQCDYCVASSAREAGGTAKSVAHGTDLQRFAVLYRLRSRLIRATGCNAGRNEPTRAAIKTCVGTSK